MVPVVVPYVHLAQPTKALGEKLQARFVLMENNTHYYRLVREYWEQGNGLFIIEQDIVFSDQQVEEILACTDLWCGFPMEYPPFGMYYGGMQKFSAELMRTHSDVIYSVARYHDNAHEPMSYCILDAALQAELRQRGVEQHRHSGALQHHKVYSYEECPHKVDLWRKNGFLV